MLIVLFFFFVSPVSAEVYKCKKDDTTVFSDKSCDQNAKKIEIRYPTEVLSVDEAKKESEALKKKADFVTKKRLLRNEITRKESSVDMLTKEMNRKLDELRQKKLMAANNLAGAIWENSLSEEMNAVSMDYGARIEKVRREIDLLVKEYDRLISDG